MYCDLNIIFEMFMYFLYFCNFKEICKIMFKKRSMEYISF